MLHDGSVERLLEMVRGYAQGEEQVATSLPGLWLYRSDRPGPPAHKRSSSMLLSVALQGQKRMRIAGVDFLYDRLSYLVMRGETEYTGAPIRASPKEPYLALGLSLSPELVTATLLELADEEPSRVALSPVPAYLAPLDAPLVDGLCRLLGTLHDPLERRVLAPLFVREIVFRLLRSDAASVLRQDLGHRAERERINKAIAYIREHAHRKLSVVSVAKHVAMSPSHFAHRFRAITSVSPMRYQKHVRLERARSLLLVDAVPVAQAAARVGYLSDAQFARDFKRHFGLSPGAYVRAFHAGGSTAFVPNALGTKADRSVRQIAGSSKKKAGLRLGA